MLVNWAWKDGVGSLEDSSNDEGEADPTLTLTQSEDGTQQTITRLLPSQAYQNLGVWIAEDGNQRRQLAIFNTKNRQLAGSHLAE